MSDQFTQLLLHCQGNNGTVLFPDSSPKNRTVTAKGAAQITTAQFKFGNAAMRCDGSTAYLDVPDDALLRAQGDYTIDFWAYPTTSPASIVFFSKAGGGGPSGRSPYSVVQESTWNFYASSGTGTFDIASAQNIGAITVGAWQHLAVVRKGNTYFLFLNGTLTTTFTSSLTPNPSTADLLIGGTPAVSQFFTGFLDEIRFSNVARWTANFTPPINPYDASGPPYPRYPAGTAPGTGIGKFVIGVTPIGTIAPFDLWTTVISQYANSSILTTIINNFFVYVDQTINMDNFFDNIWSIDVASGAGLDVWGRILGVTRVVPVFPPTVVSGVTQTFTLDDLTYRRMLLAKAAFNITDGGISSINALLVSLFPGRQNAYVADNQNMSVTYTFTFSTTAQEKSIVMGSGVIPKPVGVRAMYSMP